METKQSIRERLPWRLGPRLIGLVVLIALVAGGLVGAVLIENGRSAMRDRCLENNLATADLAATFAANYVEGAETNLRQFAARTLFLRAVFDHDVEQAEMYLAQFLQIDARFDSVSVYDAKGIGWASGLMDKWQNRGGTVADREWFQQALATRKPYFGIPVLSRATGHAAGAYAVPIFDDQGELRAVLVGGISLAALSDAITGLRVSASAQASLMDARQGGIIVAHPDQTRILTPVTEQDAALRAIAGERGTMETRSSSGELALAAFAPVPRLPWSVVILEPAEAAFAPVNALTQRALLLIGIAMVIAAVLGVLLARTITQPVRQLVIGAEEIGRGNLEYRIEVAARDEIGQLSQAFNQMTENLQAITASRDELNREIAERKRAEEKHGLIIKTALDGFWINDLKGRFLEVNESYCNMIGYTREELLTMSISDIEALEKPEDIAQRMKRVIEQSHDRFETRHRRKDGQILDIEVSINYVPMEEQCFVFLRDITVRKRVEEELRRSEGKYRSLFQNAEVGIYRSKLDGSAFLDLNNKYAEIFGFTREEMLGAPSKARWANPAERDRMVQLIKEHGSLSDYELQVVTKSGEIKTVLASIKLYPDEGYFEGTIIDITERKRADEKLKQSLAELEASRQAALNMMGDAEEARRMAELANEELKREVAERKRAEEELRKYRDQLEELVEERTRELREAQEKLILQEKLTILGQLAGGVGHELRNPLGAIKNAAYFLNMVLEEPDPEVKETLDILEKEVATSERIISSLLDFARPKPPIRRKVDINDVVREALSRVSAPENAEVVSQLDATLPAILADPDQLAQVFGNIILNAIQAMPDGGQLIVKTSEVSGKPPRSEKWVAVSIADTGVGISEENLKKLFQPLFTTRAKGIGLGLALVKTLVEGHGGTIEVESEVGKGSTFTVSLPLRQQQTGE